MLSHSQSHNTQSVLQYINIFIEIKHSVLYYKYQRIVNNKHAVLYYKYQRIVKNKIDLDWTQSLYQYQIKQKAI